MKFRITIFFFLLLLALTACQPAEPACPQDSLTYQENVISLPAPTQPPPGTAQGQVEIGGKIVEFDQVIHGPLCNNMLSGKVYIACDIVIAPWEDSPNFLDGCNFEVESGAVVTVAAHNNSVYYKGCDACHVSGDDSTP